MISANFSVCNFLALLEMGEGGGKEGYEMWVRELVGKVREEEPWLLDERDVERFISLFVEAKQLRQSMIGEAFRGRLIFLSFFLCFFFFSSSPFLFFLSYLFLSPSQP